MTENMAITIDRRGNSPDLFSYETSSVGLPYAHLAVHYRESPVDRAEVPPRDTAAKRYSFPGRNVAVYVVNLAFF